MPNTGLATPRIAYNDAYSRTWIEYLSPRAWRGRVTAEFRCVRLSEVDGAGCGIDPAKVEGWYLALINRQAIPPIVVHEKDDGRYYAHDGNHRLEAVYHFLGSQAAEATVRVAVAQPRAGWVFRRVAYDDYFTYELSQAGCERAPHILPEGGDASRAVNA